jgi:hypothetical protein
MKKQSFKYKDNPDHPIWDSLEDDEPQFVDGVCKYCGENEENCQNYKCWR